MRDRGHSLLYRYFLYGWLFRDAARGTSAERFASLRHNREQAHWLPTYMRRWLVAGLVLFGAAIFCEARLSSPAIAAAIYVPAVLTLPFELVTICCWAWLRFR
jgi:predicted LPLAT superfamily acyltransferase